MGNKSYAIWAYAILFSHCNIFQGFNVLVEKQINIFTPLK